MHNDSAILHYNQTEDDLVWDDDDWIHDDAILHFDPDKEVTPSPPPYTPAPAYTVLDSVPTTSRDPAGKGKARKIAKPRSRKKKPDVQSNNPAQLTEVDDAEWKSRMLDAIRRDDELYHRILRYDVRFPHYTRTPGL